MTLLKRLARRAQAIALSLGVVAKRSNYYSREDLRLMRFLEVNNVDTVLDVGAHSGDYAVQLLRGKFPGRIFSFEALPELHAKLTERAALYSDRWKIASRCAISDHNGFSEFHVTRAKSSSSLLSPAGPSEQLVDIFAVDEVIKVPTRTLADCIQSLEIKSDRVFLKLDIQGAEELALKGAETVLHQIVGMTVELQLQPYYDQLSSAESINAWIVERGFQLWDIQPVWRHPDTGRLDHCDATYFRTKTT